MPRLQEVCTFLEAFAPSSLAAEWDNVGLLLGDRGAEVERVMTCLTITPSSAAEAIAERANLIVTHHPLPFRPLKRITTDDTPGRLVWQLARAGIAVYSPHTAFDSALQGINQLLANLLGLTPTAPLTPAAGPGCAGLGSGRFGTLPTPMLFADIITLLKQRLGLEDVHLVGRPLRTVTQVAIACGSAGEFLPTARQLGCELFITGETNFHTCLEAEATNMMLLLLGHYASERLGIEHLAQVIAEKFPQLTVWPSRAERNPVVRV